MNQDQLWILILVNLALLVLFMGLITVWLYPDSKLDPLDADDMPVVVRDVLSHVDCDSIIKEVKKLEERCTIKLDRKHKFTRRLFDKVGQLLSLDTIDLDYVEFYRLVEGHTYDWEIKDKSVAVIFFLNDAYAGGDFCLNDTKYKGNKGDAFVYQQRLRETLYHHQVVSGVQWIARIVVKS